MLLAVNTVDVATPLELVVSLSVAAGVPLSANVPLAPEEGAVKVTLTPLEGDPFDVTVTDNVPNEPPVAALAVNPLTVVIDTVGVVLPPELPELLELPPHAASRPNAKQIKAV